MAHRVSRVNQSVGIITGKSDPFVRRPGFLEQGHYVRFTGKGRENKNGGRLVPPGLASQDVAELQGECASLRRRNGHEGPSHLLADGFFARWFHSRAPITVNAAAIPFVCGRRRCLFPARHVREEFFRRAGRRDCKLAPTRLEFCKWTRHSSSPP